MRPLFRAAAALPAAAALGWAGLFWALELAPAAFRGPLGGGLVDRSGVRRAAREWAWIRALAYYGEREPGQSESDYENGYGGYPLFLSMAERTLELDPHFAYASLFGAGILAENLRRPDEAAELLGIGMRANPDAWPLGVYAAALSYKRKGEFEKLAALLDAAASREDCPALLRRLLAHVRKIQGGRA